MENRQRLDLKAEAMVCVSGLEAMVYFVYASWFVCVLYSSFVMVPARIHTGTWQTAPRASGARTRVGTQANQRSPRFVPPVNVQLCPYGRTLEFSSRSHAPTKAAQNPLQATRCKYPHPSPRDIEGSAGGDRLTSAARHGR
jgi:hypothetical protein